MSKTRVRCYFNLHKRLFSVQTKTDKGWRVWRHLDDVCLTNVVFKVSEAGRQRVIREHKKNVHAFIEGDLHGNCGFNPSGESHEITYNPYKHPQFYSKNENSYLPITKAKAIRGYIRLNQRPNLTAIYE